MDKATLAYEAEILGKYLLKILPSDLAKILYVKAIHSTVTPIHTNDKKLLQFILRNNWSIGLVDSGLALLNPTSEIRRRIYVLYAILESMPEYHSRFLPKQRSPFYLFTIAFAGIRAVTKGIVGSLLIKIIS